MSEQAASRDPGKPLMRTCAATTATGQPCGARPLSGSDRCFTHATDDDTVERRALARRRGGLQATATTRQGLPVDSPLPCLENPEGVRQLLTQTIHDVQTGAISPAMANAVAYIANVSLRLAEIELSARVAALEQALDDRSTR